MPTVASEKAYSCSFHNGRVHHDFFKDVSEWEITAVDIIFPQRNDHLTGTLYSHTIGMSQQRTLRVSGSSYKQTTYLASYMEYGGQRMQQT